MLRPGQIKNEAWEGPMMCTALPHLEEDHNTSHSAEPTWPAWHGASCFKKRRPTTAQGKQRREPGGAAGACHLIGDASWG